MKPVLILSLSLLVYACQPKVVHDNPHVVIETSVGDIELEIFDKQAPKSAAGFLKLVDDGMYDNTSFYRVLKSGTTLRDYTSGIVQAGIYEAKPELYGTLPGIEHEPPKQTKLSNVPGAVSLARTTPGSASTEFFICVGDQTQYDSSSRSTPDGLGYAVFGNVYSGMKVVRRINSLPLKEDKIISPIKIKRIRRL